MDLPKVRQLKEAKLAFISSQSESEVHSLMHDTASRNLSNLILLCILTYPSLLIFTYLLKAPNMPGTVPLLQFATCNFLFWGPLHLLKSTIPQGSATSTVSPKILLLLAAANKALLLPASSHFSTPPLVLTPKLDVV